MMLHTIERSLSEKVSLNNFLGRESHIHTERKNLENKIYLFDGSNNNIFT